MQLTPLTGHIIELKIAADVVINEHLAFSKGDSALGTVGDSRFTITLEKIETSNGQAYSLTKHGLIIDVLKSRTHTIIPIGATIDVYLNDNQNMKTGS